MLVESVYKRLTRILEIQILNFSENCKNYHKMKLWKLLVTTSSFTNALLYQDCVLEERCRGRVRLNTRTSKMGTSCGSLTESWTMGIKIKFPVHGFLYLDQSINPYNIGLYAERSMDPSTCIYFWPRIFRKLKILAKIDYKSILKNWPNKLRNLNILAKYIFWPHFWTQHFFGPPTLEVRA